MALWHHPRTHPGIYVPDSRDFRCEDITFYHAAGIAILAERTENLRLSRIQVLCRPDSGRIFSAMADATHFVACYGEISISDCTFENQMDDAVNIHGIYGTAQEQTAPNTLEMTLHHDMQLGTVIGRADDVVSLLRPDTMLPYWSGTLTEILRLSPERFSLVFDAPLPPSLRAGDAVEDISAKPDARISQCVFRNNRARGILLTCKTAVVEDCLFESAGAAVLLEGDAAYWFESGATESIVLRRNRFCNCAYVTQWGRAVIQITPTVPRCDGTQFYHKSLLAEDCVFLGDAPTLHAENIGEVVLRRCRRESAIQVDGR